MDTTQKVMLRLCSTTTGVADDEVVYCTLKRSAPDTASHLEQSREDRITMGTGREQREGSEETAQMNREEW